MATTMPLGLFCDGARRLVWNETSPPTPSPPTPPTPPPTTTTTTTHRRQDFYDAAIERQAQLPIVRLSLASILLFEKGAAAGSGGGAAPAAAAAERVLASARHVHAQLPRRLARRLVDLQLLPHVVVSNPHIQRVYHGEF
jgi:[3-methyl-2-oxobutanoate dehydrogenase (acetyl-transferring)] kinase